MNRRNQWLLGVASLVLVAAAVFAGVKPADAGGMGGINVQAARVCLNGIRFWGTAADPAALYRTMTAQIFHGHVGAATNPAGIGSSRRFFAVNQTAKFTIVYPMNTFTVGEPVTYSVLARDGSGYGGGVVGYVENCDTYTLIRGQQATVYTTEGDRLMLRSGPGRGFAVLEQLPMDAVVTLLDGPQWTGAFTWWRVRAPDGQEGWVVESVYDRGMLIRTLLPL